MEDQHNNFESGKPPAPLSTDGDTLQNSGSNPQASSAHATGRNDHPRISMKRINETWPDYLLWAALLLLVAVTALVQIANRMAADEETSKLAPESGDMELKLGAKLAIGVHRLGGMAGSVAGDETQLLDDLYEKEDLGVIDRIRLVAVTGEMSGAEKALEQLAVADQTLDEAIKNELKTFKERQQEINEAKSKGTAFSEYAGSSLIKDQAAFDANVDAAREDIALLQRIYTGHDHDDYDYDADDLFESQQAVDDNPALFSEDELDHLITRHDWFGRLAISFDKADDNQMREDVFGDATRTTLLVILLTFCGFALLFVGIASGIAVLVLYLTGKISSGYERALRKAADPTDSPDRQISPRGEDYYYAEHPSHAQQPEHQPLQQSPDQPQKSPETASPSSAANANTPAGPYASTEAGHSKPPVTPPPVPAPTTSATSEAAIPRHPEMAEAVPAKDLYPRAERRPFFEAFIAYMFGLLALSLCAGILMGIIGVRSMWFVLLAFSPLLLLLLYPLVRQVRWQHLLAGMGFTRGKGVIIEMLCGIGGYVAGVPILLAGMMLTFIVTTITKQEATHPIAEELMNPTLGTLISIYFMACIWAPITEELMFRGALYHYLRSWAAPIVSGVLVALVFAAIHPQGISGIPMLSAIAIVMALIREWRGSIIGPITAHMLNNFVAITVSLVLL